MNRLHAELLRLYLPTETDMQATQPQCLMADGLVRAFVLELARPADWRAMSAVWQGVQVDLQLPAPAIAVSGVDGYQLWFSLVTPVPSVQATAFLQALCRRYWCDVASERITMWPAANTDATPTQISLVPMQQAKTDRWSAFVSPDLAPIFVDDPWLDLPPAADAQASLLSRLESMNVADFLAALARLCPNDALQAPSTARAAMDTRVASKQPEDDPYGFLLAVMNNSNIEMALRIQAAQALLPYCKKIHRN